MNTEIYNHVILPQCKNNSWVKGEKFMNKISLSILKSVIKQIEKKKSKKKLELSNYYVS